MFDVSPLIGQLPAMRAPPGVAVHLTTSSPEQKWYFICVPLFSIIPGIFIILRVYTKLKIVKKLDCADFLIGVSFLSFIISLSLARYGVHYGIAVHQWNLRLRDLMRLIFWLNIGEALYCPAIALVKSAIVLQYIHFLAPVPRSNRVMYFGGWALIVAMVVFYFINTLLKIFICTPREKLWNPTYIGGRCMSFTGLFLASAIFNVCSDVIMIILPVRAIWKLQVSMKKKVAVNLHFTTNFLTLFAAAMRLSCVLRLIKEGQKSDLSFEMFPLALWAWAEVAFSIIVACGLSLPRLFRGKSNETSNVSSAITQPFVIMKSVFITQTESNCELQNLNEGSVGESGSAHSPLGLTSTLVSDIASSGISLPPIERHRHLAL